MEFALSENNERITAKPHIKGFCSVCKTSMIAKCGSIYRHHWAHESKINCDPWWENETDWHRRWKEIVSPDLREVVIKRDGVTHRADVQLPSGIVVEFQKSSLPFGERIKREIFYEKMLWVFYCSREKIGNTEKIFQEGWFDDTLLELKNFNRWIYQPPHQSPMFLDFDDGTIFQVNEIDYREHLNKTTK